MAVALETAGRTPGNGGSKGPAGRDPQGSPSEEESEGEPPER